MIGEISLLTLMVIQTKSPVIWLYSFTNNKSVPLPNLFSICKFSLRLFLKDNLELERQSVMLIPTSLKYVSMYDQLLNTTISNEVVI